MSQRTLSALERIKEELGGAASAEKRRLLRALARADLRGAERVRRLHEALCFLRAYPDDERVLAAAERLLRAFPRRADLRRHRAQLAHTGIAGTETGYPFFHPTARWIARRWPRLLRLDREDAEAGDNIARALPQLLTPLEAAALRALAPPGYEALDRVRPRAATDAAFLIELVEAMPGDGFAREAFYDALNPSCLLASGKDTPARGRERFAPAPFAYPQAPRSRARPDLRGELRRGPRSLRALGPRDGQALVDLAKGVMIARQRDLDAFAYGDARDCWLADDGDGLSFGLVGVLPERRVLLPAVYGGLTLQNGVPIGYTQVDVLGRGAALSFNTFETFRGGGAGRVFARWLALLRHAFGVDAFSVEPYQLGQGNDEGIESAAWWFYYKLGFRPRSRSVSAALRPELARQRANARHRSSPAALRRLAQGYLFFELDPRRPAGLPPLAALGLSLSRALGALGPDRAAARAELEREALRRAGLRSLRGFTPGERAAWRRFGPLLALTADLRGWSRAERRAAGEVLRAKGGRSERAFAARWAAHPRLERALFAAAGAAVHPRAADRG
jgi:hypothetical protein